MEAPLVSCIVPVHNGAAHVTEALDSVLQQHYRPIEVLVVDDGSTDGTAGILAEYGRTVKVVWQPNAGPASARNAGVRASNGAFLAFLDQDDCWQPGKLERQMARLAERPELDAVVAHVESFWEGGRNRGENQPRTGPVPGYVTGTLLARRGVFEQVGLFDPDLWFVDSLDWFARADERGAAIELLPDVLLRHRVHADNLSRRGGESRAEALRVLKRALDRRRARG